MRAAASIAAWLSFFTPRSSQLGVAAISLRDRDQDFASSAPISRRATSCVSPAARDWPHGSHFGNLRLRAAVKAIAGCRRAGRKLPFSSVALLRACRRRRDAGARTRRATPRRGYAPTRWISCVLPARRTGLALGGLPVTLLIGRRLARTRRATRRLRQPVSGAPTEIMALTKLLGRPVTAHRLRAPDLRRRRGGRGPRHPLRGESPEQ